MNDNFKVIYSKKNMSEIEQKLLERIVISDSDVSHWRIEYTDKPVEIESVLKLYTDESNMAYLIFTYLKGEELSIGCAYLSEGAWNLLEDNDD